MRSPADTVRDVTDSRAPVQDDVLCVHFGRSANCSSIGSVVDVLFVSGVVGTAVLASVAVLLGGDRDEGHEGAAETTSGAAADDASRAATHGREGGAAP